MNDDGTPSSSLASTSSSSSVLPSYLAIGSESGAATIYSTSTSVSSAFEATKKKSILNLTTVITSMAFHPSHQLLAIASNQVDFTFLLHQLKRAIMLFNIYFSER